MFDFKRDPKKAFWQWLSSHRAKIQEEISGPDPTNHRHWSIHELGRQLKNVSEDLVHEIGMADPSTIELIISADGIKAAFPAVIDLVNSAPALDGYKITAFRPRCADGFQLNVSGLKITDHMLTYRLIQESESINIELFIDCDLDQKTRTIVGFLSLDQRLGEFDVATGFKWINFHNGRPTDAFPITQLAQDFDALRGMATH